MVVEIEELQVLTEENRNLFAMEALYSGTFTLPHGALIFPS